jgi:hypothetical protein
MEDKEKALLYWLRLSFDKFLIVDMSNTSICQIMTYPIINKILNEM